MIQPASSDWSHQACFAGLIIRDALYFAWLMNAPYPCDLGFESLDDSVFYFTWLEIITYPDIQSFRGLHLERTKK